MWRIFNYIFGWQYVTYMFGSSMSVGRVKMMGNIIFVHECCTGYIPMHKATRDMYPLTMSKEDFEEMREHNKKEDTNGRQKNIPIRMGNR